MNTKQRLQLELQEYQTLQQRYSFKRMKKDELEEDLSLKEDTKENKKTTDND